MEPVSIPRGTAGALVGGLQNIGSGVLAWLSAMLPQTGQRQSGIADDPYGIADLACWLPLASRISHQGRSGLVSLARKTFAGRFYSARSSH